MAFLRDLLLDPRTREGALDDDGLLREHEHIVREKRLLRSAFLTFYTTLTRLCDTYFSVEGLELELGSGAGFFKEVRPGLITSDVRKSPHIDRVIDALAMDIPDDSVRCIYAINVFHHLRSPDAFFQELIRVLRPGGGSILVEPHIGAFSAWMHKRLHTTEFFDPMMPGWEAHIVSPMSGANQALAHIVFERDRKIFQERYGSWLEVVATEYVLNGLRYLLSGGVNFRPLAPAFVDRPLQLLEKLGKPLAKHWSLHKLIVLRKCRCRDAGCFPYPS